MLELFQRLTALPHRGSATPNEAQAAQVLREHLESGGFTVQTQRFKAPRSYGPELIAICLALALGGWLEFWPLALLGTYAFWANFSGWWVPWSRLFDRFDSQNLLSHWGSGPRTLVLMAHYDSAKTYFVYSPRRVKSFRANFLLNAALASLMPYATFLPVVPQVLALYFLAQALLLLWRERTAPTVNGANDNASGVAVAVRLFEELREQPLEGTRVILALTGCEEVGAKGAEFLAQSGEIPKGALVLNIDNVGRGKLHYATGEGMLIYHRFRGALQKAAKAQEGAQALEYRLAYFDTRPFAARRMGCLTLIRLEDGLPPHWHWPTDRPENVDWAAVEGTLEYARRLVYSGLSA